jgi:hypothetical protein
MQFAPLGIQVFHRCLLGWIVARPGRGSHAARTGSG